MFSVSVESIVWSVAISVLTYVSYFLIKEGLAEYNRRQILSKIPGVPPQFWLTGHIIELPNVAEEGLKWIRERSHEYPRIARICYGPQTVVSINNPVLAKPVFKSSEPKPRDFGAYKFARPWLGDGLLLAGGSKWARNRRLLTPAFHFDILKPYMMVNNKAVDILVEKFDKFAAEERYFEAFQHVSMLTLDIILKCAFSYETECQTLGDTHPYVKAVQVISESAVQRLLKPWLYPDLMFFFSKVGREFYKRTKYVHSIAEDVIRKRKETLDTDGQVILKDRKYLDFLDILLTCKDENGAGLSDKDIRNEVDTFLFEGHDTTASGISWALYSLAEHPEHQKLCQEEIDNILDGRSEDHITWDDLNRMPYTTMCIKEALRLHAPVPFIERILTKDMYIDGYFVPAGTMVDLQLYVMAHNSYVWEDPMKYDPERFLPERIKDKDSFSYVPFSAGPRNCIGQNFAMHEMKVAIARILRRYKLRVDPDRPAKHEIKVVMKTEDGMYLAADRRQLEEELHEQIKEIEKPLVNSQLANGHAKTTAAD